jgi:hypothetical protein
VPVWEFPLYHRNQRGEFRIQEFLLSDESELQLTPSQQELERKQQMFSQHVSQREVLSQFDPGKECFRPMAAYDFAAPPHPGVLNYEGWGWSMTGKQLCAAFNACAHKRSPLEMALLPPTRLAA